MRPFNYPIANDGNMNADVYSAPIPVSMATYASLHAAWTGSPVGTLLIEASDDSTFTLPWATIAASQISINGPGNVIYGLSEIGYAFIRLHYEAVSGSGALSAIINGRIEQ